MPANVVRSLLAQDAPIRSILALASVLSLAAGCGSDETAVGPKPVADVTSDTGGGVGDITSDTGADTGADTSADTGVDTTVDDGAGDATDGDGTDSDAADTGGDASQCPGGPGCACSSSSDCTSDVCLDTHEGKRCAVPCTDSCAAGYSCQNIGESNTLTVCVSTQLALCAPCKFHSDCSVNKVDSLCLDYGASGKYCGAPCAATSDCPSGYTCGEEDTGAGGKTKQCRKDAGAAGADVCGCSAWATAKGMETECMATNEFGTCKASRACGAGGLSACAAKTPASEVCNQQDDNCDGTTDNLPADLGCTVKAFQDKGSLFDCTSDADCKVTGEACDAVGGKCKLLIGACAGKPKCSADGKLLCEGAATPALETCNGADDDCDGQKDEDFQATGPAGPIAVGAACGLGGCAGGTVVCVDATNAACSTANKAAKETCDGADQDCDGATDNAACDDGDACTTDTCDAAAKSCANVAAASCDDKEPCTVDSCDKTTGACVHAPGSGSCDDGNPCTIGDLCKESGGKVSCNAGPSQKDCNDSNPCTDDGCEQASGCTHKPNSGQVECYNGPKGTSGVGLCKGGKQFCKDGAMLDKCEGEIVPAKAEGCDGKDDDCDGLTDEGCKPTDVAITFAGARVQGKAGQLDVDMLVGRGAPAGPAAAGPGGKYSAEFGFFAWWKALVK